MNILQKIDKYTAPTIDDFIDSSQRVVNDLNLQERVAMAIPNESVRKGLMKNIDMMRSFLTDNLELYSKGFDKG